jgi:hypothetical protein
VTGNAANAVSLAVAFERTSIGLLSGREKRNRADFEADLIAALGEREVRFDSKMARRWRDPCATELEAWEGNRSRDQGGTGSDGRLGKSPPLPEAHFGRSYPVIPRRVTIAAIFSYPASRWTTFVISGIVVLTHERASNRSCPSGEVDRLGTPPAINKEVTPLTHDADGIVFRDDGRFPNVV